MPISSLIVRTTDDRIPEVIEGIEKLDGVTVFEKRGANIIAVTETKSRDEDKVIWEKLENIPGVIGVSLAYHNFEDLELEKKENNL